MKALFYVLNNADLLLPLLEKFNSVDIKGCTIFETDGMGRELVKNHDEFSSMFAGLRSLMTPNLKKTKTLMFILKEEKVQSVVDIIESVVGSLEIPESGILFTMPLDFVKGIKL